MLKNKSFLYEFAVCAFIVIVVSVIILAASDMLNPFGNIYNSYSLQAQRWLSGHTDLGANYSHLEIACYGGKYYISFPPFPSVVLLPFVLIFGTQTPDNIISIAFAVISTFFALKIAHRHSITGRSAVLWTLLLTVGSNFTFIMSTGWVWFMAQTMAFAFLLASIYFMLCKRCTLSFLLWSFAVGCRPFCIVYFPFMIYYLYKNGTKVSEIIKSLIPAAIVGLSYMLLNFLRFGNILEFGHNYLPEFTQAANGQFSLSYMPENLYKLIRIPLFWGERAQEFNFNGFNLFLASPIYAVYIILLLKCKKRPQDIILAVLIITHILLFTVHKTMGGWQFGNRYTVDALPFVYLGCLSLKNKENTKYLLPLAAFGLVFNLIGTIRLFIG